MPLRVGKPLFCEAWRLGFCVTHGMYTSSSRGSKRKADKMSMLTFTSSLALGEGKPAPPTKSRKPRNRLFRVSGLVTLVSSRRFPTQTTTVQQMADQPHPLRACSLVVWQCIAFATSFLLASQTTSVAATASCMTLLVTPQPKSLLRAAELGRKRVKRPAVSVTSR